MAARPLTANQRRFAQEYLVDLNATRAAARAGYSAKTAEQQGSRLLRNAQVAEFIGELQQRRSDRVEVKTDDVLRELLRLAMVDTTQAFDENGAPRPLKELPLDLRRAISGIEVEQSVLDDGVVTRVSKLKFWSKDKALELLGKHLKLFTDKLEVTGKLSLEQLVEASMKPLEAK